MGLSKSQADKLGDRLREADIPTDKDLALLEDFRTAYDNPLAEVEEQIAARLGVYVVSRGKTIGTMIEKLRREPMRLSQMQDIVGCRLVEPLTLSEQSRRASEIARLFPGSKVQDLRETPHVGYRAVHVILKVQGFPIEVQLRTAMQDAWAQTYERFADRWGREMRYGAPPRDPEELVNGLSRQAFVDLLLSLSPKIAAAEGISNITDVLAQSLNDLDSAGASDSDEYTALLEEYALARSVLEARRSELSEAVVELLEALGTPTTAANPDEIAP